MALIEELQKKLEESQEGWISIDKVANQLESQIDELTKEGNTIPGIDILNAKLLLLLVKQLKPMSNLNSKEIEQSFADLFSAFSGNKA